MEENQIVSDVIDEVPPSTISINYPDNKTVNNGNELTPIEVKQQPEVKWETEPDTYYTLALVDPDAPSREDPKFRAFNHWLVVNISGSDVASGNVIAEYAGSVPGKGLGLHRYVFLVYKQKGRIEFDETRISANKRAPRRSFSIRNFAEKYDIGKPIAGNFYLAQWDAYVEERNKRIID